MEAYTFSSPRPQNFQLPSFMVKYIQNYWSSTVYQKLTLTCKQFFATHQIVCVDRVFLEHRHFGNWSGECRTKPKNAVSLWSQEKLWITESLIITYDWIYMFDRIYKSTLTYLDIWQLPMEYDDFVKIAENLKELRMHGSCIIDDKEEPLGLGDIASLLPNLCKLKICSNLKLRSNFTLSLPYMPKLKQLIIKYNVFNIDDLCEFIKMHPKRKFKLKVGNMRNLLEQTFCQLFPQAIPKNSVKRNWHTWSLEFDFTIIKLKHYENPYFPR